VNLQGVLKDIADTSIIPIEELFVFRPRLGRYRIEKRIRKIQTDLHIMNINNVTAYGNNILFAAWGSQYDVLLNKLNKKGITPSLIMCSTPGQSELSRHELKNYHSIIRYLRMGKLKHWLLNKRLYDSIGRIITQCTYFPHTLDLHQFQLIQPQILKGKNIELFCKPRLGKNIINQILAFKISGTLAQLHINFSDKLIDPIINDFNVEIVRHEWIVDSGYYSLIAAMDLSLQATFTESFSYAVAERMCLGIPVITSFDIYLTADDAFLSKHLCVQALDTPSKIAVLIKEIIEHDTLRQDLGKKCQEVIECIAQKNNKEARDFIVNFLD
jgi:glycosyltransferase involved in cell wall biosynthesis